MYSNNDNFKNNYSDIYLDELKLKKENKVSCKALFLNNLCNDLAIICDRKFRTKLGNQKGVFPFYINCV